jgi:hypothetical protein
MLETQEKQIEDFCDLPTDDKCGGGGIGQARAKILLTDGAELFKN